MIMQSLCKVIMQSLCKLWYHCLKRTECNFGSYEISATRPLHDRLRTRLRPQVAAATATQTPRDRLAACAYCRRLFGRALQNELRVICLTAQALLCPRTERNLAVMKFPLHDCRATAPRVAPASITAR
jgi:hypothetical protein